VARIGKLGKALLAEAARVEAVQVWAGERQKLQIARKLKAQGLLIEIGVQKFQLAGKE
jgi:hypothetical protein